MKYESPIQDSFDATTQNYEKNALICLNQIKNRDVGTVKFIIASHNEDTVRFAVKKYDFDTFYFKVLRAFLRMLNVFDFNSLYLKVTNIVTKP